MRPVYDGGLAARLRRAETRLRRAEMEFRAASAASDAARQRRIEAVSDALAAGMSQREVARALGVSASRVAQIASRLDAA